MSSTSRTWKCAVRAAVGAQHLEVLARLAEAIAAQPDQILRRLCAWPCRPRQLWPARPHYKPG